VSSNRGYIKAVAVVTKRIKPLQVDGKTVHHVGIPLHWGFKGVAKNGFITNTLTPFVGDGTPRRRSSSPSSSTSRKPEETAMALQSLDIAKRSATTTESPQARKTLEVAKLIDVSKCIGCKACQVACMQWNDLRDEVGTCAGTYDNPAT
jgi:hypothetical protein